MPMIDLAAVGERRGPEVPTGVGRGGRNDALFRLAASLRARGYGDDELLAELFAANATFDPPLPDREVVGRARSVLRYEPGTSSGDASSAAAPQRRERESWSPPIVHRVGRPDLLPDMGGLSPVGQARAWVRALFAEEDVVCLCTRVRSRFPRSEWYAYAGQLLEESDPLMGRMLEAGGREQGLFAVVNPMRDDVARRSDANVSEHRWCVVECDELGAAEQLERVCALLFNEERRGPRCHAITWSGNKSYHAIVRVGATDRASYDRGVASLYAYCAANGLPVDAHCGNPSRLTRVPGSRRGESMQRLVWANA